MNALFRPSSHFPRTKKTPFYIPNPTSSCPKKDPHEVRVSSKIIPGGITLQVTSLSKNLEARVDGKKRSLLGRNGLLLRLLLGLLGLLLLGLTVGLAVRGGSLLGLEAGDLLLCLLNVLFSR